ncbi:MAG: Gfo/Idh/MocA family oxidoreductase, partial [Sedimentisphaerales bacterium]|nr:Gfo/Idh/MocA family oxidoreductase [Sedimentisphaerales bacterium]
MQKRANQISFTRSAGRKEYLHIGLIGAGLQGRALAAACLRLNPQASVRIQAVCDIWPRNLDSLSNMLGKLSHWGHQARPYRNYRQMLTEEADLDAVLIATPDFCHSEQTIACLDKGLHVYCEPEMSNTIEGAGAMVLAARRTGKLLQIGRQRRSNPQYKHSVEILLQEEEILNQLTSVLAQHHRSQDICGPRGWPVESELSETELLQHGYHSMHELRNWRFVRRLGGGHFIEAATHQLDVFRWLLGDVRPASVIACGTKGYWPDNELFDTVVAVFEFPTPSGVVRAMYDLLMTNSSQASFEQFMGDQGTLVLSEDRHWSAAFREGWIANKDVAPKEWAKWVRWVNSGVLIDNEGHHKPEVEYLDWSPREKEETQQETVSAVDVRESPTPPRYQLPSVVHYPAYDTHLKNFFDAIRGKAQLTCPASEAFATTVMTLKT